MGKKKTKKSADTADAPAAAAPAAAPTTPEAPVDKAAYQAWERSVCEKFYTADRPPTALLPTDGAPSVLSKEKFILVADAGFAAQVASGAAGGLPAHQHVQLWHLGKQKEDGVRFGLAAEEGLFKHPACDVGGLTNLK